MPRTTPTRRLAATFVILTITLLVGLSAQRLWRAGAQAVLSAPVVVLGDASASGVKERARARTFNATGDSAYSNEALAPLVSLAQFSPNTYQEPATVQINATATDPEGIQQVEFYFTTEASYPNYTLLNTDVSAPYAFSWNNLNLGYEQWVRRRSTAQISDQAYRLAVDSSGNAFVTGIAYAITNSIQTRDLVTVKYSSTGQELWAVRLSGAPGSPGIIPLPSNPISNDSGGIAIDPSGSVYVFGTNQPNSTASDYLLLKYDPASGALVWSRAWSGQSADYARDMAIDAGGNVYLTGETWDGAYQDATSQETWNAGTVKFDSDGNLLWSRIYRGFPGKADAGRSIVLDASGNAYVAAYSAGFINRHRCDQVSAGRDGVVGLPLR